MILEKAGPIHMPSLLIILAALLAPVLADIGFTPVPPLASGYGTPGRYVVAIDSIRHPAFRGAFVYLFHPRAESGAWPVIFFCHGIGEAAPAAYEALVDHMVSRGFAVVYSPYPALTASVAPRRAYDILWCGIQASVAAAAWRPYLDTSRIGFVGHSFGGGAVPSLAYKALVEQHWGTRGAFLHIMAPWYSYNISKKQLAAFPRSTFLIVEVFADDAINDHRMARDIFSGIGIPEAQKTYAVLYSDSVKGFCLKADHNVPLGKADGTGVNALDSYGIYRIFDALADCALERNEEARSLLLEKGERLLPMGTWFDGTPVFCLSTTKSPVIFRPQSFYRNFWAHAMNPRARFTSVGDLLEYALLTPVTLWNYYQHLIAKTL